MAFMGKHCHNCAAGKSDFHLRLSRFTSQSGGSLIPAMLKSSALLVPLLLLLSQAAQEAQVLPDPGPAPAVDPISPVPPPLNPLGTNGTLEFVMPKDVTITNQGGTIEGSTETGVRFGGPVKVTGDNGMEIFSNSALLDLPTQSITFEGEVSVYQGNSLQRGQRAVYYYQRKFLDASGMRASLDPLLLEAGKFTAEQHGNKQVYVGNDGGVTTHDVQNPNFWVRAKKTTIYPEDKIVFNNMWLYAGKTPIFWLPYLSQPLNADLGYHFLPGARSTWGAYLLSTYGIMLGGETDPLTGDTKDAWLLSRWHVDLRSTRGVGTGVDLIDTRIENRKEISGLSLAYLYDLAPETSPTGLTREPMDANRYAASLKYRVTPKIEGNADWRFDSDLNLLSDTHYLQDFSREVYRTNPSPDNTLGVYRRDDRSLMSLYVRLRLNDFYRTDTRLPELAYDQVRAPLFGLPVLHEGKTSIGLIGQKAADGTQSALINPLMNRTLADPAAQRLLDQLSGYELQLARQMLALPLNDPRRQAIKTQLEDTSYGRFNTYQEISLPMMFGNFLSVVPEAGIGYSRYFAQNGPAGDSNRTQLHVGTESSFKFSKDYSSYQNHDWGLDGISHVCQPYANWSLLSANNLALGDPMVDRLTPTTQPRPIDPMRFTATDEMQSWNVLRVGARNSLITKRNDAKFAWLYLDTYLNAFMNAPDNEQAFSNIYNDIQWRPLPWLTAYVSNQFPITNDKSSYNEFNTSLHFMPTDFFDFTLGTRRLSGQPTQTDTNLFVLRTYTRLSENWGIGTDHMLELENHTLPYQQYTLHRDLGNWVAGMGITIRDNLYKKEYGIMFSLSLKDFPAATLPFEMNAP
jgi:LPS-assembly protein